MSTDPPPRELVVDDEPANLRLLTRLLQGCGIGEVDTTTDPAEAVRLCRRRRPDLLVLDLHMPQLDGLAVLRSIGTRAEVLPTALQGDRAPPAGRIVAVVDVFDALVHERVSKPAWPSGEARGWICDQRGTLFDPDLTDALLGVGDETLLAPLA